MYRIGSERFFSMSSTKRALENLAGKDHLVVYCGAGVTIDQTGLGWGSMLAAAFGAQRRELDGFEGWASFAQMASALAERETSTSSREDVAQRLREHLYRKALIWSGDLVDRVAFLVIAAVLAGKRVSVVSTNYDDFVIAQIRDLARLAGATPSEGAIEVDVHDDLTKFVGTPRRRDRVNVFYLHGRVPPRAKASARLVLTEPDYAETRDDSVTFLTDLLGEDVALLVLGSGLSDPPLVDALASSRDASRTRVALWALEPTQMHRADQCEDYLRLLRLRASHIGLTLLTPDFLFQIPQFCTELAQGLLDPKGVSAHVEGPVRYGARLTAWWDLFSASDHSAPIPMYERLAERQAQVMALLDPPRESREEFRLDLWLRSNPSTRRELRLWASSVGPMMEPSAYKVQPLALGSGHATVTGFVRGRPAVLSRKDLNGSKRRGTRWRSFLVVPVGAIVANVITPVGAATLCSTNGRATSSLTALDEPDLRYLVSLLQDILPAGDVS